MLQLSLHTNLRSLTLRAQSNLRETMIRLRHQHWEAVRSLCRIVNDVYGAPQEFVYGWTDPARPRFIEVGDCPFEILKCLASHPGAFPSLSVDGLLDPKCHVGVVLARHAHRTDETGTLVSRPLRMAFSSCSADWVSGSAWFDDTPYTFMNPTTPTPENLRDLLLAARAAIRHLST